MAPDRKKEIQGAIIRAMSAFGVDISEPYQSMSIIGLHEMRRNIPREEFLSVLNSMDGVIIDFEKSPTQIEVRIPTGYFIDQVFPGSVKCS